MSAKFPRGGGGSRTFFSSKSKYYSMCHLLKASKQFGSRSGPTERRTWFGSKPFDIRIMLYKESIGKVNFGFKSADDNKCIKKIHV